MDERDPLRFSPVEVVGASLAYLAANLRDVARWSVAPLLYGLVFHFFRPGLPQSGQDASFPLGTLLLLGFVLLWVRVPLEVRVIRSVLLGERPSQFYGLQLVEARTWSYTWAYLRVMLMVIGVLGPVLLLSSLMLGELMGKQSPDSVTGGLAAAAPVLVSFALLAGVYALLAPRIILAFPDVALGGKGLLFNPGRLVTFATRARWRMVAVMALVWAPEHCLNVVGFTAGDTEWWRALAGQWWFAAVSFLLGFATMVVSCVAGAMIYGRLAFALKEAEGQE